MERIIYTTFFCIKCQRTLTIKGENSWTELAGDLQGLSKLHFVTFVKCWMCAQVYTNPVSEPDMKIDEVPIRYMSSLKRIHKIICPDGPLVLHVFIPSEGPNYTLTEEQGMMRKDEMIYPVMNMDVVKRSIDFPYEAMSIITDVVMDPVPNFIESGPTLMREKPTLTTPMIVHNIFFCPACRRNVILSGFISLTPLFERVYEEEDQAVVHAVVCRKCQDEKSITDEKGLRLFLSIMDYDMNVIDNIGSVVGVRPTTQGHAQASIMHRIKSMNHLGHMCDKWSAIDGRKTKAFGDFI